MRSQNTNDGPEARRQFLRGASAAAGLESALRDLKNGAGGSRGQVRRLTPEGHVLVVGQMATGQPQRRSQSRKPARALLRGLAALVAALLLASSFGQIAHFALVRHAICREHGELLELHGAAEAQLGAKAEAQLGAKAEKAAARNDGQQRAEAPASDSGSEHDHCQMVARNQREQGLVPAPALALARAAAAGLVPASTAAVELVRPLAPLQLAPKTSPPRWSIVG
jgi:hypothetical protein